MKNSILYFIFALVLTSCDATPENAKPDADEKTVEVDKTVILDKGYTQLHVYEYERGGMLYLLFHDDFDGGVDIVNFTLDSLQYAEFTDTTKGK